MHVAIDLPQHLKDAMTLPVIERSALVESLLSSLDLSEPRIDALFVKEDRIAAFDSGAMPAVDAEEAFAKLERP